MSRELDRFVIRGDIHVTLSAVARCYGVTVTFVEEAYEHGLLGTGERVGGGIAISAIQLDRVARIVQLHFHQGVSLPGVVLLLGPLES